MNTRVCVLVRNYVAVFVCVYITLSLYPRGI